MTIAKSCLEAAQVTCPPELPLECGTYCDFTLNIGVFFDGTDNHKERDTATQSQSNIARLSDAYLHKPLEGFFSHYIEGVGTPAMEKFGTDGENAFEAAAGKGGEPRIIWGLLQILNSVHRFINRDDPMFDLKQMKVLCSAHHVTREQRNEWPQPIPSEEDNILKALDLDSGLVGNEENRESFLRICANKLNSQLSDRKTLPCIAGIYLDIFGFSRGAAQARVFTNWLHQHFLIKGKLFGKPSYVRMLGLMDTVASVGFTNATGGEGHWGWAIPKNLHIHPDVQNCVHYVALHELRTVFPCDSVCFNKTLPDNCYEHYYPGAHSDVGGGYEPGFQGKAVTSQENDSWGKPVGIADDSHKLSQLPLNDMYQAARKTCEDHIYRPWLEVKAKSDTDTNPLIQQFALDPEVRTSVETYLSSCKIPKQLSIDQQLREHGLLYLTWRYLLTQQEKFEGLYSVHYAQQLDEDSLTYYRQGERIFAEQIREVAKNIWDRYTTDQTKPVRLGRHAKDIYKRISKNKNLTPEISRFYDRMVHDSYAGFIKKLGKLRDAVEGEGYLRYRAVYLGDNTRLNALANEPEKQFA